MLIRLFQHAPICWGGADQAISRACGRLKQPDKHEEPSARTVLGQCAAWNPSKANPRSTWFPCEPRALPSLPARPMSSVFSGIRRTFFLPGC